MSVPLTPTLPAAAIPGTTLAELVSILDSECESAYRPALLSLLSGCRVDAETVTICNAPEVRQRIGILARMAAFGSLNACLAAHRFATLVAASLGIFPASIDQLYRAMGEGTIRRHLTVPAVNMRAIAFESARAVFQAMAEAHCSALVFELSRGEIGFTHQRPHEYATAILCAAIAEKHHGAVFIQGDHFQVSASQYRNDPNAELSALMVLIEQAISAGFYNIDIDTSTLVALSHDRVTDQQALSVQLSAQLASFTRRLEPFGVSISLGGEIGEVGEHNSTPEELYAYLDGVAACLPADCAGLSKISIQSGTRHGGNVLADGTFGDMPIDFSLIRSLSKICRQQFGVGGCVQHGASMLTMEKLARLPESGCIEVHLAAGFLNDVYNNLPPEQVKCIDDWLEARYQQEWKSGWSRPQFLHHARRYAVGPNKRQWWDEVTSHDAIRQAIKTRAAMCIQALKVENTGTLVSSVITHAPAGWIAPPAAMAASHSGSHTINDLAS